MDVCSLCSEKGCVFERCVEKESHARTEPETEIEKTCVFVIFSVYLQSAWHNLLYAEISIREFLSCSFTSFVVRRAKMCICCMPQLLLNNSIVPYFDATTPLKVHSRVVSF